MSASKGNVGEHLAMAELLWRGFDAYWADRGNPAFDIACFWNETRRATRLRVKTTSNGDAVWTAKKSGLFLDVQPRDDYVLICNLAAGIRSSSIYLVPTPVVEGHLVNAHEFYCSTVGPRGKPRDASSSIRVLRFYGEPKPTNIAYGYQDTFAQYLENWDLLK